MDPAGDEHGIEAHARGAQDIGLKPVADRKHLVLGRVAGASERMRVDCRERLSVPGHPAAEHLVDVGDRTGTGLGYSPSNDHPIGVEAMHMDIALGEHLQLGAIVFRVRLVLVMPVQARSVKFALGDPDPPAFEHRAIASGADEADRLVQAAMSAAIPASPLVAMKS